MEQQLTTIGETSSSFAVPTTEEDAKGSTFSERTTEENTARTASDTVMNFIFTTI